MMSFAQGSNRKVSIVREHFFSSPFAKMSKILIYVSIILEIWSTTSPSVDGIIHCRCNRLPIRSLTDSGAQDYPESIENAMIQGVQRLKGGGLKRIKKLTSEQQAYVDAIKFPPEMAKDIRRHWKKKPEMLHVPQEGGKIVKVRTAWVLQRIKEKALERKKQMESLPMRLLDLGTKGVRWIRDLPGQILGQLFAKKQDTAR